MPNRNSKRGKSSAAKGPRIPSPRRVAKNTSTSSIRLNPSMLADGFDSTRLHPLYQPQTSSVRSPIRTRGKSAQSDALKQQQQPSTAAAAAAAVNVPTRNAFESLSGEEDNGIADSSDADSVSSRKSTSKTKGPGRRPPPIFCVSTLAEKVDGLLQGLRYCLKIGKKNVQIITFEKPEYVKVLNVLKLRNVKYFTFNPAEDVPIKVVLQGYAGEREVSELKGHLADVNIQPRDIKVLSKTTTETGTHVLYLLYFDRGTVKIQDLRRHKSLDGFWVSWRYYSKNPSDAAQCHRCQHFGHGSSQCNLPPRCVKCGETHFTERCTLPRKASLTETSAQQQKSRVKCANCDGNHTANYRGCAARKAYLEEQEKRKKKASATRPPQKPSYSTVLGAGLGPADKKNPAFFPGWGGSYARVAAGAADTVPEQANVTGEDLFTLPEFFALAGEMLTRFRACRNKAEQFLALGELMMQFVYNG